MSRVATIPLQNTLSGAILKSQRNLSASQLQLDTGKKSQDFAGLGTDAVRTLSSRSMLARQEAHKAVTERVGVTLSFYDSNLSAMDDSLSKLRLSLLEAIGTGDTPGLQKIIESDFASFKSTMNATEAGVALFAGSRTDTPPFTLNTLSDTVGINPADAFVNDQVRITGRVGDGVDVEFGILANEVGEKLVQVFQTLATAGTFGLKPNATQVNAMKQAVTELDTGLANLRAISGENGRKQNQVEILGDRAEQRGQLLTELIGRTEDVNLGQVAIDLAARKATLEASYTAFSQLSGLSLANYLR